MDRPPQSLWISGIAGGGDGKDDVETAVFDLARIVAREEAAMPPIDPAIDAVVDVTFHLPGTFFRPDYRGIRTGRWVPRKRLIVVQVAVPPLVGNSSQIREFLAASLRDSVVLATEFLAEKRRSLSTSRATAVAERAATALTS